MTAPKMVLCRALWINCSNINNYAKSHGYQLKFQNKQEVDLHITDSRSAAPLTKESHGWKNCFYVFTRRLDTH